MFDFTSALYLGMHHTPNSLRPWTTLTSGRPAALYTPQEADRVAAQLAHMLGCQRATLGTSTLHLFLDLFEVLADEPIALYVDASSYPVARWGIERVVAKGVPAFEFGTHDAALLEELLDERRDQSQRPVVVTDGLNPITGAVAPLPQYLRSVRARRGYLVIDDTQALGILGRHPIPSTPYGLGGGGTPAWCGLEGPEIVLVSSLAKGFGAPLAVMAGSDPMIAAFERSSATREHCSPPSLAAIAAAERALAINARM